jgi:AcrR family transcriptional regulator
VVVCGSAGGVATAGPAGLAPFVQTSNGGMPQVIPEGCLDLRGYARHVGASNIEDIAAVEGAGQMRRPMRRDAREHRDRLVVAARREFAARGVDASLERIAREAGVSIGTLYRHFPARLDLLMAAFRPRVREFLDGAADALAIEDPWDGLVYYLENLFAMQVGDRGFTDFLSRRFTDNAETERVHDQMCQDIEDVLVRSQRAGQARPDITRADIINLIWSNGRIIDATSTTAPEAWRRQLHLVLDAYRAERAHPLPEPPMTDGQLYDAMVHLGAAR